MTALQNASAGLNGITSTSPSGGNTPYGNLSLAGAQAGGGAPGALTPPSSATPKDKEKKEGLYPSRVVLTSRSYTVRIVLTL